MSTPAIYGQKAFARGFDLAVRVLAGESFDVRTLQRELNVSRATAYRYWRLLRSHGAAGGARSATADVDAAG